MTASSCRDDSNFCTPTHKRKPATQLQRPHGIPNMHIYIGSCRHAAATSAGNAHLRLLLHVLRLCAATTCLWILQQAPEIRPLQAIAPQHGSVALLQMDSMTSVDAIAGVSAAGIVSTSSQSPRSRRDPSPAELGRLRSQSITNQVRSSQAPLACSAIICMRCGMWGCDTNLNPCCLCQNDMTECLSTAFVHAAKTVGSILSRKCCRA